MLLEFFKDPFIEVDLELREKICNQTGLKWMQVYKWLFDYRNNMIDGHDHIKTRLDKFAKKNHRK